MTEPTRHDDGLGAPPVLGRSAGAGLGLSALLLLGAAAALVLDDGRAALVLLVLLAVVTVPVLAAALLSLRPALVLLRGGPAPVRTPACAALLALGHVGIAVLALRPGLDAAFSTGELLSAGVAALGLGAALLALSVSVPGSGTVLRLRLLLALSGGVLVLALVALRAVAQTS